MRGFLVNASNPKGTVFLLAVVPQFIDAARPLTAQYLAIAGTMAMTDTVAMAFYTLLAAKVLRLMRSPGHIKWMNRAFGTLFMAAGLLLACFRRAH
jgi:homoserine/homoserine lactone efflux protein